MIIRSKREEINAPTATGPIGPGSYNPELPTFKPKSGMAPFGSTVARDYGGAVVIRDTPGPGQYSDTPVTTNGSSAMLGGLHGSGMKPSPVFVSKVARLAKEQQADVPGPGAYFSELVVPPKRHSAPSKLHAAEGINWVKVATAPSIPSRHHATGYEEGPSGKLIQQPPPVKPHTGVGDDRVGPGEYNPSLAGVKILRGATNFGKSKASRPSPVPPELASHPGPGAYKAELFGTSDLLKGGVMNRHSTSAFASQSSRDDGGALQAVASTVPGPGTYQLPGGFKSLKHHLSQCPETFQVFGSTSKTSAVTLSDPLLDGRHESPGPGWYDVPIVKHLHAGHPLPPTAAFAAGGTRFGSAGRSRAGNEAAMPGPGSYEVGADTMVKRLADKTTGAFGAFGSTSRRLPGPSKGRKVPGPGEYDTDREPKNPADLRRTDRRSSAFRSRSKRGEDLVPKGAADEPGPGAYNLSYEPMKPTTKAINVFVNTSPRFVSDAVSEAPGPGQYEASMPPRAGVKPPVSMPRAERFGHPRKLAKEADSVPGPGTYQTVPPLLKRSFNISIGGSAV